MAQTAKAVLYSDSGGCVTEEIAAAVAGEYGDVLQMADGGPGVVLGADGATTAFSAGDMITIARTGKFKILKSASVVLLNGGEVMWDHSAESATYPVYTTSKDFFLGRVFGDAVAGDATILVDIGARRDASYIDLHKSAFDHAPILTAGTPVGSMQGGSYRAAFSLTAEAQKLDLLSIDSFSVDSNWIFEGVATVVANADADVGDLNIGVANATHASDGDSITESCFLHFDMGADLNLDAESDDGTTEVAATDTTVDWVVGTPVHFVIDGRDESDIQVYVNGANVLPATTFKLNNATGPLKALFHLEKSANDSPGTVRLDKLEVRLQADVLA